MILSKMISLLVIAALCGQAAAQVSIASGNLNGFSNTIFMEAGDVVTTTTTGNSIINTAVDSDISGNNAASSGTVSNFAQGINLAGTSASPFETFSQSALNLGATSSQIDSNAGLSTTGGFSTFAESQANNNEPTATSGGFDSAAGAFTSFASARAFDDVDEYLAGGSSAGTSFTGGLLFAGTGAGDPTGNLGSFFDGDIATQTLGGTGAVFDSSDIVTTTAVGGGTGQGCIGVDCANIALGRRILN